MKHFILFIALFSSTVMWAQDLNYIVKGRITNVDLGGNEGGVTISLVKNGTIIASTQSASSGKYSLVGSGPKTGKYEIVYSKPGFVTKKISFDGSKLNEEDIPSGNEIPFPTLDMDLFTERPNVDFSFLNTEYVASFFWDEKKLLLDFDRVASSKVRAKIDNLLLQAEKEKAAADINYQKAITQADALFGQKKYEEALVKYEEALGIKPKEPYPASKIVELDALIQAQKQQQLIADQADAEYNNLIKAADNLRDQGKLEDAVSKYKEAITKKNEQYPKDQITTLTAKIAALKKEAENQAAYTAAISAGDMFMKQNSLKAAKDKYTEAIQLKPSEKYPKDKLAEIESKLKAQEATDIKKKQYDEAIAAADALFLKEDYTGAKTKYELALTLESAATYPKQRIILCDQKSKELADLKLKKEAYDKAIQEGTSLMSAGKLEDAKSKFEQALSIDGTQQLPKDKIAELTTLIKAKSDDAANKAKYDAAIAAGNLNFNSKKWDVAKGKFEEALSLKPNDPIAQAKIDEITKLLLEEKAASDKLNQINQLLADGDSNQSQGKLTEALSKYEDVLKLDPNNAKAKAGIVATNNQIKLNKEAEANQSAFELAKKEGFDLASAGKNKEAIAKLNVALTFKDDASVKAKIKEIETFEKEAAQKELAIATLLKEGNAFVSQNKLIEAKAKFEKVLVLDPLNKIAQEELAEINTKIASQKSDEEKEKAFELLKSDGVKLLAAKDYQNAKNKFLEALSLKEDAFVQAKLDEIAKAIELQQKEDSTNKKYDDLLKDAASFEGSGDLDAAILKYKAASQLKPAESLPKTKIKELEDRLKNLSDQAKIDAEYTAVMNQAEELMVKKEYLAAIKLFNKAGLIKPESKEPSIRAAEAERLEKSKGEEVDEQYEKILSVAQQKMDNNDLDKAIELLNRAISLKPTDTRPKAMINEVNTIKKNNAEYLSAINSGNQLAGSKKYTEAIKSYEKAASLKPNEVEPRDKIAEMNKLIAALSSASQKDDLYNGYMNEGKSFQNAKRYQEALSEYQNALSVKPNDSDALSKINEIQQILDDIENKNNANLALQNKFDELIKQADELFAQESYIKAKAPYEAALKLIPTNKYAKLQIDECVRLAKNKGSAEAEKEYQKIISAADKNFSKASYDKAREYYNRALTFKSNDPYPKSKLAEIDAILNPKTIASVKLEDLGDPFDNSIMDGQFLLEKAEEQRKLLKGTQVKAELNEIQDAEALKTLEKTKDHQENSNQIYLVQQKITADAGESDLNRQATVEAIRLSEMERQAVERSNQSFEYSENILDQTMLNTIVEESALEYGERHAVYETNSDLMKSYNTLQANEISNRDLADYQLNHKADITLTGVKNKVSGDYRDDYDERAKVKGQVVIAEVKAVQDQVDRGNGAYDKTLLNKDEVRKIQLSYEEKSVEDAKSSMENNEDLLDVKGNVVSKDQQLAELKQAHSYKTDDEISNVKMKVLDDGIERDVNRNETVELLRNSDKELAEVNAETYNSEMAKYVSNKAVIKEHVEVNSGVDEKANDAHAIKVAYMKQVDKKATVDYTESKISDETERQNFKKSVENSYTNVQSGTSDAALKLENNTASITDTKKTIETKDANKNIGEKEKHYEASKTLSQISDKPVTSTKTANELGNEYPEGVSQESFTQNDQNGLMKAIITRRIVVIDGHADVYVRTQTIHGTTYSKNDKPSLDHVWNKETQGPHLERHY